nr:AraC family transcriptional regulator [Odoribacter splanchnicus]
MRTKISNKKRDGFAGELLISIPQNVLARAIQKGQILPHQLYVSHIGYFPKALYHYCQRPQGCVDNILFYCVQGKGYYTLDGHTFTLNPNQYVIVPATDKPLVYWSDTEDPWSIYWVHFTSDALQAFNRAYHIVPEQGPQYIPHNEKGIRIWEEMYENLSRGYSPENLMNTNLCLYHLIATFVFSQQQNQNSSSPEKAIIRETIDYMKNNLDKTIRIEDFADLNKYSVSHFSKLFRLTTGMSPIEYFIHLKMQKACQLLYTEDSRVKQIAALLGYDDPYYFSRLFKKYMNTSPETYRKSVRKIH